MVYGTFGVALMFLPLLALEGLPGRFFAPLAQSYLLAVMASLAVALVVTPALALLVLGEHPPPAKEPRLQARAKALYRDLLEAVLPRGRALAAGVAGLCAAALVTAHFLGGEFLPPFQEGHLVLQVVAAPGTSLDEMLRIGRRLSRDLATLPEIESVEQQIGRAERGEDTWGPNRSELHVELRRSRGADDRRTVEEVRSVLAAMPGIQSEVMTFLGDRISETLSGETAEVVVQLFGDDLDGLEASAARVAEVLRETPGAVDVQPGEASTAPHLSVQLRPDVLARYGFRSADVLDPVEAALAGVTVAQVQREGRALDVVVRLEGAQRNDPALLPDLLVRSPTGATLTLGELADTRVREARDVIFHEGGRRRQTVTCNVEGRDVVLVRGRGKGSASRRSRCPAEAPS